MDAGIRDEWIRRMDDAVAEVFRSMLECDCAAVEESPGPGPGILASITFSGTMEAHCVVEFPSSTAKILTSAFLASDETDWDDAMIGDAVGELCNMIAGGWKRRLGPPAQASDLSIPCISRVPAGSRDRGTKKPDGMLVRRAYAFDAAPFVVCLSMD
jgi:chemotaxis protein CheX